MTTVTTKRPTMDDLPSGTEVWLAQNGTSTKLEDLPEALVSRLASHSLTVAIVCANRAAFHRPLRWELEQMKLGNLPLPAWMLEEAREDEAAQRDGCSRNIDPDCDLDGTADMEIRHIAWIDQAYATRFPDRDEAHPEARAQVAAQVAQMIADGLHHDEPDISELPDVEHTYRLSASCRRRLSAGGTGSWA